MCDKEFTPPLHFFSFKFQCHLFVIVIQDNSKYQFNEVEKMVKRSNTELYVAGDYIEEASKFIPKHSFSDFDFLISGFPVKFR
jgi:hypothetical protein